MEENAKKPDADVALIHGRTPDGEGLRVLRKRGDQLELGAIHPLKEGAALHGEVVTLTPRKESPLLCDVKVELDARPEQAKGKPASLSHAGPAQVASDDYRRNWDVIFKREEPKLVN